MLLHAAEHVGEPFLASPLRPKNLCYQGVTALTPEVMLKFADV